MSETTKPLSVNIGHFFEVYQDPYSNTWKWYFRTAKNRIVLISKPNGYASMDYAKASIAMFCKCVRVLHRSYKCVGQTNGEYLIEFYTKHDFLIARSYTYYGNMSNCAKAARNIKRLIQNFDPEIRIRQNREL